MYMCERRMAMYMKEFIKYNQSRILVALAALGVAVWVLLALVPLVSGAPAVDVSNSYAFPVPFKPSEGQQTIQFTNLPSDATIKIFDVAGGLVRTLREPNGEGILHWDVTNDKGEPLASDVFLYSIESAEQKRMGKLMVVR